MDNPKYRESILRRMKVVLECSERDNKGYTESAVAAQAVQLAMCARDPIYWINTFGFTYDPRLATQGQIARVPFDLYPRQVDLINWVFARIINQEAGLLEKSRGIGWTWASAAIALHKWIFAPGFLTSFGSRKEELVDTIGDPKSIFSKIRDFLYALPIWMLPPEFDRKKHDNHCKLINPFNGNTITGEAGQNMGRGGRSSLYCIDEAAFIDEAESVNAAIIDNSDCRIWASTVNGPGNLFAKMRHDGSFRQDQIFTFHWRDDPRRDDEWAKKRRQELSATPWVWYSEYEIDYSASVEGICIPASWVNAALELGRILPELTIEELKNSNPAIAGLDIGDGVAESVYIYRRGPVITAPIAWTRPDSTDTAHEALSKAREDKIHILNFDTVGVGKGVLSVLTHAINDLPAPLDPLLNPNLSLAHKAAQGVKITPINTGIPASWQRKWPDGQTSRQKCFNLKAECWWIMREGFRCAAEHLAFLNGSNTADITPQSHALDDLLIFDPKSPPGAFRELIVQVSAPKRTYNAHGKIQLETKQQLASRGVASPDRAEALSLTFVPDGVQKSLQSSPQPMLIPGNKTYYPEISTPTPPMTLTPAQGSFRPPAVRTGTPYDAAFSRDW